MTLLPGSQVRARGLRWEVLGVEPAREQERYRLRCLAGGLHGMEIDLLAPFERIEPLARELDPVRAGRLKAWRLYHDAFLLEQALGPDALLAAQPGRLDLAPYQLVPVMRALRMSRPRLLLADGVGLGKTVQAGLVLSELLARRRAHRVLIVAPAGPLLDQWDLELRVRFGLRFRKIKRWDDLQEIRRGLELGSNPFDHLSFCLTSYTFARQEKVLQDLERSTWDMVVIDEAHHAFRMGSAGEREDKITRKLAETLARRSDGLLLLTATPHDGFDPHFASLVELLDPSLVDGRGGLRGDAYRRHVVRRLKRHVKHPETGAALFPERAVHPRPVPLDPACAPRFAELHRGLLALVVPRLRSAVRRRRYEDVLAFLALLKRSVSTAQACGSTLRVIAERHAELRARGAEDQEARRERLRTLRDYRQRLSRFGTLSFEEEEDQARLEASDMAAELFSGAADLDDAIEEHERDVRRSRDRLRSAQEVGAELERLATLADEARAEDPKLSRIVTELREIREREPRANVLVYTEYTDSQDALVAALRAALAKGSISGDVLSIRGADDDRARTAATTRFTGEDDLVLVSTDATAEGLNLHARCHHLLHLELPYNPNRLEQRNGRIDRYGQRHAPEIRYLFLQGTFEERLLLRLVAKFERQRARLTFVPDTLGGVIDPSAGSSKLLEGLLEEEGALFRAAQPLELSSPEPDDTDSLAYRDLLEEVDRALSGFERSARLHSWLGDSGLAAEGSFSDEAARARERGERLGAVDLLEFVCGAVEADQGRVSTDSRGVVRLQLPPTWSHGLADLPGFDEAERVLRITTDKALTCDAEGRDVGYLGRAHPIVRRALDRVRNLQHGTGAETPLDRRVSAALGPGSKPSLLFTFLGQVQEARARALERVLAVLVVEGEAPRALSDPEEWLALAGEPTPPAGVWERHFAHWDREGLETARAAARAAFEPLASAFLSSQRTALGRERRDLDEWLRTRTDELCGAPAALQQGLFEADTAASRWQALGEPTERLAALSADKSVPVAQRREADGVLRLLETRRADLARREELAVPAPEVLGLLMLVPAGASGGP